jgi:hypothetical protein
MTASEPGAERPARPEGLALDEPRDGDPRPRRNTRRPEFTPLGGKPIVWQWWLAAAVISLCLWGGIYALVR